MKKPVKQDWRLYHDLGPLCVFFQFLSMILLEIQVLIGQQLIPVGSNFSITGRREKHANRIPQRIRS